MLVEGEWRTERQRQDEEGRFVRAETSFHDFVTADGSGGYRAEPDRYHLYISWACPWAPTGCISWARSTGSAIPAKP